MNRQPRLVSAMGRLGNGYAGPASPRVGANLLDIQEG